MTPGHCATGSARPALNSGMAWPAAGITVGLGPASLFRRGCGLDLAIAVAVQAASGAVPPEAGAGRVFAAELGLDGRLRPVHGIVPILAAAAERGRPITAMVAPGNQAEAALLPGISRAVRVAAAGGRLAARRAAAR